MTARIKNFKTDFTRFLGEKIKHTVQIITKEETLECSGVLLSQHSEVMRKMVEKEEKILLNSYEYVKECLLILHGGSVELTEENCEEIIKFGIQFGLTDIVEQGLEYLASHTDENNLENSQKICTNANRFAESCNSDANIDYFWPLERTLEKLSETDVKEFVAQINTKVGIKAIVEMIKNRCLAKELLIPFIPLIDQSNIGNILAILSCYENCDEYAEALSNCPRGEISFFFEKIEALELEKKQLKTFQILKKCTLKETETNVFKPKSSKEDWSTSWKQFGVETIQQFCKVFETDFYMIEVVMSWVALNKPDLKIVRQLCTLMNTTELEKKYLEHVIQVFNTEGYEVSFDLNNCNTKQDHNIFKPKHDFQDITSYTYENNEYTATSRVVKSANRGYSFDSSNNINFTVSINKDGISWSGYTNNCTKIYGRTVEGKQIPFYTDLQVVMDASTMYDFTTLRSWR